MDQLWANRAASAEAAIAERHIRRLWQLPGTQLGVVGWPPTRRDSWFGSWHYWWQAHLLDCLVDAQERDPQPARLASIKRQIRGHRLRNNGRWTNSYYDDMAWLALSLERRRRSPVSPGRRPSKAQRSVRQFLGARGRRRNPWRKQDQFFNAPANGPAGIFLARFGDRLRRAQQMADWIDETLIDPDTKLVFDGIKGGSLVRAQYTYCQGWWWAGDGTGGADLRRAPHCQGCAADRCDPETHGPGRCPERRRGGDGGLFSGITARYLAFAAMDLPGDSPEVRGQREWVPGDRHRIGGGGVGQPPDRRWTAVVRPVVGHRRRGADG